MQQCGFIQEHQLTWEDKNGEKCHTTRPTAIADSKLESIRFHT